MSESSKPSRRSAASRSPAARQPAASRPRRPSGASSSTRRGKDADARIRAFAVEAARLIHDSHMQDVLLLDVRGLSGIQDYVLIGTGASDRQIRSVADDVAKLGAAHGMVRIGTEADGGANWVVLDLADVVVHLFEPATRAHYDLEMMWGDAPRVTWRRRPSTRRAATKKAGNSQ